MIGTARKILGLLLSEVEGRYLTHEVLTTFLNEVSVIMKSRPLTPISSDPHCQEILNPSTLLTQMFGCEVQPLQNFDLKDISVFRCWLVFSGPVGRKSTFKNFQMRCKWQNIQTNLKMGDVVLMKDDQACRNDWPMGTVINSISSDDGRVRAAEVPVVKDDRATAYSSSFTAGFLI